jgi:hypothetical protein
MRRGRFEFPGLRRIQFPGVTEVVNDANAPILTRFQQSKQLTVRQSYGFAARRLVFRQRSHDRRHGRPSPEC